MCNPAHVTAQEPYNLHDVGQISWVGSVLYKSCTTSHKCRLVSTVDDLDRDLSDACDDAMTSGSVLIVAPPIKVIRSWEISDGELANNS